MKSRIGNAFISIFYVVSLALGAAGLGVIAAILCKLLLARIGVLP